MRCSGSSAASATRCRCWCAGSSGWRPSAIFALMLPRSARTAAQAFVGAMGFYIAAYSAGAAFCSSCCCTRTRSRSRRLPMREFARAALPGQLIAFSSSSSIASLPALVRGAEDELELPKDVTGFVLPLAISMFKFAAPVSWTFGTLFVAWFYSSNWDPSAYFTIAFAAIFLAFAAPGCREAPF